MKLAFIATRDLSYRLGDTNSLYYISARDNKKLRFWRPELKFVYNSSGYDKAAMIRLLKIV